MASLHRLGPLHVALEAKRFRHVAVAILGEYLTSTDAWQRFAIWLLHKHFERPRAR